MFRIMNTHEWLVTDRSMYIINFCDGCYGETWKELLQTYHKFKLAAPTVREKTR